MDQLIDDVGDLQKEVESLGRGRIVAVSVLESEPPILLNIESFVLTFPPYTTSVAREFDDVGCRDSQVLDPFERGDGRGSVFRGGRLRALEHG